MSSMGGRPAKAHPINETSVPRGLRYGRPVARDRLQQRPRSPASTPLSTGIRSLVAVGLA